MKKLYALLVFLLPVIALAVYSCESGDDDSYTPVSPVSVDLTLVPYAKLSDYKFFDGDMKDQVPALGVLPYAPSSVLFSDYAHKKRFVWMPNGTKATYDSDRTPLELPVGAALVKTFYYENVQNVTPTGATRLVETRVMIRKADGWIFACYVWNEEQTEAYYDVAGSDTPITWQDESGLTKSVNYHIPNMSQCIVCHKFQNLETTMHIPIGIKPQNLNFALDYGTETKNQLQKWVDYGYLQPGFAFPSPQNTVVDYNDASQPLEDRARAYFDSNCSHCHSDNRHCDYRPMRFAYADTYHNRAHLGVCVSTEDMQGFPPELATIVSPGSIDQSMLFYRINTTNETFRMPLHGRTLIHQEGVLLIKNWINSLDPCD
jgi:uncharacterized repeat protein (TIGR03806 family)